MTTPDTIHASNDESLRALGLSKQKISYARSLVEANIDFAALRNMDTEQVISTLVVVKGVGEWTAEIYAMFSLGHADVFAHNDLALQEGARMLFDLPQRPTLKGMKALAAAWSPWRAVAARLLWAYYAYQKSRPGIMN
jgi:DNA-3-methyladenine glycosylase II